MSAGPVVHDGIEVKIVCGWIRATFAENAGTVVHGSVGDKVLRVLICAAEAATIGRVGEVDGQLVGAVVRVVADAITIGVADAAIAAEVKADDASDGVADAPIGVCDFCRIDSRQNAIECAREREGVVAVHGDARQGQSCGCAVGDVDADFCIGRIELGSGSDNGDVSQNRGA